MWNLSGLVLLLVAATFVTDLTAANTDTDFSDCASNLGTLENALFETGSNLFELNRIFFPPSLRPTRFVRVEYSFLNHGNEKTDCNVTYIWAIGEALFLQPPTLFKLNSLFFYYPNNELIVLHLQLPIECIPLINGTDGICSCMNDSHMLDILTQQLNIYAKFTNQENVERSPTYARAVCAGELYDIYHSGKDSDFAYIIAAAAIAGPLSLLLLASIYIILTISRKKEEQQDPEQPNQGQQKVRQNNMKRKNLVALVLVGIYFMIYILILDFLAANVVCTSKHEYERELSGHNPFNLVVTYITLICDLVAFVILIVMLLAIAIIKVYILDTYIQDVGPLEDMIKELTKNETKNEIKIQHLNKLRNLKKKNEKKIKHFKVKNKEYALKRENEIEDLMKNLKVEKEAIINILCFYLLAAPCLCIMSHFGYIVLAWITEPSRSTTTLVLYYFTFSYLFLVFRKSYKVLAKYTDKTQQAEDSQSDRMNVFVFFFNIPLGVFFIGVAVLFIMAVYLMPLASEDLFNYLFNVIQFMIVVISTQFAYRLLVGKEFSLKMVIKSVKKHLKIEEKYSPLKDAKNIAEETGHFIVSEMLVPYVLKNKQKVKNKQKANAASGTVVAMSVNQGEVPHDSPTE